MNCPSEVDKAYLAGLIDADGSIILTYVGGKQKTSLRPMINVTNTNKKVLLWIKKTFHGFVHARPKIPKQRHVYHFCIGARETCLDILNNIVPYLKIKQKQGLLLQTYLKNHVRMSRVTSKKDLRISLKIKKLNKRGD